MGIPFFDFTKIPLQKQETNQTFGNMLSNAFEGYQGGKQLKEEQKQRELSTAEQQLKNALLQEYGRERQQAEIDYLRNQVISEGVKPDLIRAEIAEKEARAKHYSEGGGKSSIPASVRASEYNAGLANQQRVFLDPIMQHKYQGANSTLKLANDISRYHMTKDPQVKADLIKAGVANKLAPEFAGFQLIGQKVRPTVHALHLQEKAIKQGWANKFDTFMNNLPEDIQNEVNKLHSDILRQSSEIQSTGLENLGPTGPRSLSGNRELPMEPEENIRNALSKVQQESGQEMVTIRNPKTGETKTVTLEEAKRMGAK